MKNKKAQIQSTFHWVYILIAGVVILLFFAGTVVKVSKRSEESLQRDVVRVMESILVAAGVSEKTKREIDISGLKDYVFEFNCQEEQGTFGLKGKITKEISLEPIFAPLEIKSSKLILWSLPYKLPFKVTDLLIVTSLNTKYFVFGGEGTKFREELEKDVLPEEKEGFKLNFEFVESGKEGEIDLGENYQARVIDLEGRIKERDSVPGNLGKGGDDKITAVSLTSSGKMFYFQKEGNKWKKTGEAEIISMAEGKEAAKYAALFAADAESYQCNMVKAFKRLRYLNEVYESKLNEIIAFYDRNPGALQREACLLGFSFFDTDFRFFKSAVPSCLLLGQNYCTELPAKAEKLQKVNYELFREGCLSLY